MTLLGITRVRYPEGSVQSDFANEEEEMNSPSHGRVGVDPDWDSDLYLNLLYTTISFVKFPLRVVKTIDSHIPMVNTKQYRSSSKFILDLCSRDRANKRCCSIY